MKIVHKHTPREPQTSELLDALWQAMNSGLLPKVPGFYDRILETRKKAPKAP